MCEKTCSTLPKFDIMPTDMCQDHKADNDKMCTEEYYKKRCAKTCSDTPDTCKNYLKGNKCEEILEEESYMCKQSADFKEFCCTACENKANEPVETVTFIVSTIADYKGKHKMEAEWKGPKDTRFDITKFEAENLLDDENCGKKLSECKHRYGANGYYIRADNGKCVRALHCHYAGYDDVKFEIKEAGVGAGFTSKIGNIGFMFTMVTLAGVCGFSIARFKNKEETRYERL